MITQPSLPEQAYTATPAMDAAGLGEWEIDLASNTARCSPRAEQLLGITGSLAARPLSSLLSTFLTDDQPAVAEAFALVRSTGKLQFERRVRNAEDGAIRWLHVQGGLGPDAANSAKLLGVVADVTDWHLREERRLQAEKMDAIGHVCGRIAHDYNNFLMAVGTNLEMFDEQTPGSERAHRFYSAAHDGLKRGALFNESLMELSGRHELLLTRVRLDELLPSLQAALQAELGPSIKLELRGSKEPLLCITDARQLEAAMLHLASNARDAMPLGGKLTIALSTSVINGPDAVAYDVAPGQFVVISINDTGMGIEERSLARVFEPFFTTKQVRRAKGLGLSKVYTLARKSGGFVHIQSELASGTSVLIHLPQVT